LRISSVPTRSGVPLTLLQAEKEPDLRALVLFSSTGYSWARSSDLRKRLLDAVAHIRAPIFFINAANAYSVNPGKALDARVVQLGRPHRLKFYRQSAARPMT